jgi:hypothetical protein
LIAKSKNELQKVAYKKCEKHNLKISPLKTKAVGFCGENIKKMRKT